VKELNDLTIGNLENSKLLRALTLQLLKFQENEMLNKFLKKVHLLK
jgi:hypothetical protein